ncbi:hypothetical protein L1887_27767 [Cichorium endivia]|nr:hypothetical protein L1887_27767 [Cichorium endivia]
MKVQDFILWCRRDFSWRKGLTALEFSNMILKLKNPYPTHAEGEDNQCIIFQHGTVAIKIINSEGCESQATRKEN